MESVGIRYEKRLELIIMLVIYWHQPRSRESFVSPNTVTVFSTDLAALSHLEKSLPPSVYNQHHCSSEGLQPLDQKSHAMADAA
jgi:hypothetical protein